MSGNRLDDFPAQIFEITYADVGEVVKALDKFKSEVGSITFIQGTATFTGSETLDVRSPDGSTQSIAFEKCILATGSRSMTLPGLTLQSDHLWDSTSALDLKEIPESLLVIGGSYIGLELGSVYAQLGSKVTVVEMLPGLMPGADRDLVRAGNRTF